MCIPVSCPLFQEHFWFGFFWEVVCLCWCFVSNIADLTKLLSSDFLRCRRIASTKDRRQSENRKALFGSYETRGMGSLVIIHRWNITFWVHFTKWFEWNWTVIFILKYICMIWIILTDFSRKVVKIVFFSLFIFFILFFYLFVLFIYLFVYSFLLFLLFVCHSGILTRNAVFSEILFFRNTYSKNVLIGIKLYPQEMVNMQNQTSHH